MLRYRRLNRNANLLRFRSSCGARQAHELNAPALILRCSVCGSAAIEVIGPVRDDKIVRCAGCGLEAGHLSEFLGRLEKLIDRWRGTDVAGTSRCEGGPRP